MKTHIDLEVAAISQLKDYDSACVLGLPERATFPAAAAIRCAGARDGIPPPGPCPSHTLLVFPETEHLKAFESSRRVPTSNYKSNATPEWGVRESFRVQLYLA
uniref:Uncharacterized protein n=1 Tax=Heliothis virescens TaxID=7102 RepID=A0A2A4JZ88_HELVI